MIKQIITSIALCLLSTNVHSYCMDSDGQTPNTTNSLTIMTYNVNGLPDVINSIKKHKSFEPKRIRLTNLCEFLKTSQIDVVMLQEVWLKKDAEALADFCGYKHVCYNDDKSFQTGLVILSKNPITSCSKKIFQERVSTSSGIESIMDKVIRRGFLNANIVLPSGQELTLVNTHTISNYEPNPEKTQTNTLKFKQDTNEAVRLKQIKEIFDYTKEINIPVIIGGDFNTGPEYPLWNEIKTLASESGFFYDENYIPTFSNTNKYVSNTEGSLDHFFLKNIDIKDTVVLSEKSAIAESSDHYAKVMNVSVCCEPQIQIAAR